MATTNSTSKKLTKRDHFNTLLQLPEVAANPTLVEFINNELDLLARKNNSDNKKPTEKDIANQGLKTAILEFATASGEQHTVTDFIKNVPACAGLSQQKISAMVRQMVEDGNLEKVIVKRVSYFRVPEGV